MAEINQRHLQHQGPTDVITFDYRSQDDELWAEDDDEDGDPTIGEILICPAVAAEACETHQTTMAEELVLYGVHGCLHLAGYDDHEPDDQKAMRAAERRIMDRLLKEFSLNNILVSGPSVASPADADGRAAQP